MRLLLGSTYLSEISKLVHGARETLRLMIYNASPPNARSPVGVQTLWSRLTAAPAKGLNCYALIQTFAPDSPQQLANLAAGDLLRAHHWHAIHTTGTALVHAKMLIADSHALLLGSHNLTNRGLTGHGDASVLITDPDLIVQAATWYDHLRLSHRARSIP